MECAVCYISNTFSHPVSDCDTRLRIKAARLRLSEGRKKGEMDPVFGLSSDLSDLTRKCEILQNSPHPSHMCCTSRHCRRHAKSRFFVVGLFGNFVRMLWSDDWLSASSKRQVLRVSSQGQQLWHEGKQGVNQQVPGSVRWKIRVSGKRRLRLAVRVTRAPSELHLSGSDCTNKPFN